MSVLVFGGLSLCKKALQAIGEYIPQEVKNLHVYIYTCVCYPFYGAKSSSAVCVFRVKMSNALDTGAECESEEAKTLLGFENQCMAQIPLSENTLASQLIINSIFLKSVFFFFFHVNWCWAGGGQNGVNAAIVRPSCPCWKASALPTRTSQRLMLSQLRKERVFLCGGLVQCLGLVILNKSWNNWLGCWNVRSPPQNPPINASVLLWKSLGNLFWCSHTGFEEFCSRKGSLKRYTWFYITI